MVSKTEESIRSWKRSVVKKAGARCGYLQVGCKEKERWMYDRAVERREDSVMAVSGCGAYA